MCQYFVQLQLEIICKQFPQSIICNYIDDILLGDSDSDIFSKVFTLEKNVWQHKENFALLGITCCFWKIQIRDSINFLGHKIGLQKI